MTSSVQLRTKAKSMVYACQEPNQSKRRFKQPSSAACPLAQIPSTKNEDRRPASLQCSWLEATGMKPFRWDENYNTDLLAVDQQHRHLVEQINLLGALSSQHEIDPEQVENLFADLKDYAEYHFREEEDLMIDMDVDHRHRLKHIDAHQQFIDDVTSMHDDCQSENPEAIKVLFQFLTHWLAYHILGLDQNMARQISAIKQGEAPATAYLLQEKQSESATEPLLAALQALFEQVSTRSRLLRELNQTLEAKVAERTRELSEANAKLEELTLTDALTGLANRRHAMRQLQTLWQESSELGQPLACMMIDADHFKQVNDNYGHPSGDKVLLSLATLLRHSVHNDDLVCRLGGDEFLILCPNTDLDGAIHLAELIHEKVIEMHVPTGDSEWKGSVSIGVAARQATMCEQSELIKRADEAVYKAKESGKNCVRSTRDLL